MKSPFDDLQVDAKLVCEFFAVFARFEYAMKATRYCKGDRHDNALPDWISLRDSLGIKIAEMQDQTIDRAVSYLLNEPPQVQKFVDNQPRFCPLPLDGDNAGAMAIEATKRVRNNLLHGGKHTQHSPPDRDTRLIHSAMRVLDACLIADSELSAEFECQLA